MEIRVAMVSHPGEVGGRPVARAGGAARTPPDSRAGTRPAPIWISGQPSNRENQDAEHRGRDAGPQSQVTMARAASPPISVTLRTSIGTATSAFIPASFIDM